MPPAPLGTTRPSPAPLAPQIYGKAEYAGTDPGKEIMNQLGVPVGPPRGPAKPMTADQITQLRADMKAVGLIPVA